MAVRGWNPFPAGYRLLSGTKLNNIFTGNDLVPSMRFGTGAARPLVSQSLVLAVPSQTNTDFTISLPTGATIRTFAVYTTAAFGAVTDAVLSIGSAAGGAQYAAATSIKAVGVVSLTLVAAQAASLLSLPAGSPNIFVRITQSGGNSATGAAVLEINYILP